MKLKTFFGSSLQDAMRQAKSELGEDVILLNSRRITQDNLAGSKSNLVEITTALDTANRVETNPAIVENSSLMKTANGKQFLDFLSEQKRNKVFQTVTEKELEDEAEYLRQELKNMRNRFREITDHKFSGVFLNVYGQLLDVGICPDHAASYVRRAFLELGQDKDIEQEEILEYIHSEIAVLFFRNSSCAEVGASLKREIIAFIGPSGSGKTTTLMKMSINKNVFES